MNNDSDQSYLPFNDIKLAYREIYIILAPPRSSSTAFAWVFWECPSINFYCHEPFDSVYHQQLDLRFAEKALLHPLDLNRFCGPKNETNLLIKDMTFQVGKNFLHLVSLTSKPILFIIQNPKLSILSRMQKRQESKFWSTICFTEHYQHEHSHSL